MLDKLKGLFRKKENLISVDIGSTSIRLAEIEMDGGSPTLKNLAIAPTPTDVFSGNAISKADRIGEVIAGLLERNKFSEKRAVIAMPGPSVFTKRIKVQKMPHAELAGMIQLEAGNYIPHSSADSVRIDYHVIGEGGRTQLDVLIVAVKNEIVDSFITALSFAGLETAVVDIEHFAIQNSFEVSYPEHTERTVALVNMGARYSTINICRGGQSLFAGDVALGGKNITDTLGSELVLGPEVIEALKRGKHVEGVEPARFQEALKSEIDRIASELNRQLSFFWNASGADRGIDCIGLIGGSAALSGLRAEVSKRTGVECLDIDPLQGLVVGETFDPKFIKEIGPTLGVCVGMGLRQPGDRAELEYD